MNEQQKELSMQAKQVKGEAQIPIDKTRRNGPVCVRDAQIY